MISVLLCLEQFQDSRFLILAIGWNHHVAALTDDLGGRVSKNILGAMVPGADNSIERAAHDCVVRIFDDRRERRPARRR